MYTGCQPSVTGGLGCGSASSVVTETVYLPDNALTFVNITNTDDQGSYFIIVEPVAFPGATATFSASSGSSGVIGSVVKHTSSASTTNEVIDIGWPINSPVQLQHSVVKTGGTGADIPYTVRVIKIG